MDLTVSYNILDVINFILITFAFLKFFAKCGIPKKYAFIPVLRIFKLAQFTGKEDDGNLWCLSQIISTIFNIIYFILVQKDYAFKSTIYMTLMIAFVFSIMSIVYVIRIYIEVCRVFNRKKGWAILWFMLPWLPAFIWGCSSKYQPVNRIKTKEAAGLSGITAEILEEGLTINIEERSTYNSFKKKVLLKDIHMNIRPGHMVLLLGGSGAGKTTFINAVTGYEKAKASILLNGRDIYKEFDELKYQIGTVPQQDLIRYNDTVEKTLTDMAELRLPYSVSRKEKKQKISEILEVFGLTPVKGNLVGKQSGGQKKRISIASEFIADPDLFILDEPDSGLDGILARELMQKLHDISRQGKIVIVITHTPDRVIDLFDDLIVLAKDQDRTGRLVFFGSIEESRKFFNTDNMESIVRMINRKDEGGEGRADELIEKYKEVYHGQA